jgi:hypothetical protein
MNLRFGLLCLSMISATAAETVESLDDVFTLKLHRPGEGDAVSIEATRQLASALDYRGKVELDIDREQLNALVKAVRRDEAKLEPLRPQTLITLLSAATAYVHALGDEQKEKLAHAHQPTALTTISPPTVQKTIESDTAVELAAKTLDEIREREIKRTSKKNKLTPEELKIAEANDAQLRVMAETIIAGNARARLGNRGVAFIALVKAINEHLDATNNDEVGRKAFLQRITGGESFIKLNEVRALVDEGIRKWEADVRTRHDELVKRALSLEIQADLAEPTRGGGTRIEVLGYTTLADGNRAQVARQEFPDENTAKELSSNLKTKAELESELKNAKVSSEHIESLRDQAQAQARVIADLISTEALALGPTTKAVARLQGELTRHAEAATSKTIQNARAVIDPLMSALTVIENNVASLKKRISTNDINPADVGALATEARALEEAVNSATTAIKGWPAQQTLIAENQVGAEVKTAAQTANIVIGKLSAQLAPILSKMTKLAELLDNSDTLAQAAAFGKRLPTLAPQPTPQSASAALDGLVNLDGSGAAPGQVLRLRWFLTHADGDKKGLPSGGAAMEVDKLGWSSHPSAHLLLANRIGDGQNFVLAPALSQTWNYHPDGVDNDFQRSSFEQGWRFLDPGIGVAVVALPVQDKIELGVAAQLSIFSGFISGGYGFDVQADNNRTFWYIGLDLVKSFSSLTP